ncbi:hypothetical protein CDAR_440741 [Caerostris darwini]|uniref:Maturase K n=1 Tax=Caerostris darwini TaxID=1538125 RepID=A0AAV4MKN1_9ARAC|nr:hypothetical protein CDAR_440741 [Caerostris darwini]
MEKDSMWFRELLASESPVDSSSLVVASMYIPYFLNVMRVERIDSRSRHFAKGLSSLQKHRSELFYPLTVLARTIYLGRWQRGTKSFSHRVSYNYGNCLAEKLLFKVILVMPMYHGRRSKTDKSEESMIHFRQLQ